MRWHGEALGRFIHAQLGRPPIVLDCTCGIGAQSIGLALQGYTVRGTDVSLASIECASSEAAGFGVAPTFAVAGVRNLADTVSRTTTYRALLRDELGSFLQAAGFVGVSWHMPDVSWYVDPLVTARRP